MEIREGTTVTDADEKKTVIGVIRIVVGIFLLVHAIILFKYSTLSPCAAAAQRIVEAQYAASAKPPKNNAEAFGQALGKSMSEGILLKLAYARIEQRPVLSCYSIALGMSDPK